MQDDFPRDKKHCTHPVQCSSTIKTDGTDATISLEDLESVRGLLNTGFYDQLVELKERICHKLQESPKDANPRGASSSSLHKMNHHHMQYKTSVASDVQSAHPQSVLVTNTSVVTNHKVRSRNRRSNVNANANSNTNSNSNGDKPFECSFCGKCFARKDYLTKHIRSHTGEKPYQCMVCSRYFKQKSGLSYHLKHVHAKQ